MIDLIQAIKLLKAEIEKPILLEEKQSYQDAIRILIAEQILLEKEEYRIGKEHEDYLSDTSTGKENG